MPVLEARGGERCAQPGAEDFSVTSAWCPVFFFLGCTPKEKNCKDAPSNHSPRFYVDESGLKLGVRSLATLAADWLRANAA